MRCWNPNTPGVPPILNAGDTWKFTVSYPKYPASAGWTVSLQLVSPNSVKTFAGTTNANGSDFDFLVPIASTLTISAGPYSYRVIVTGSGPFAGQQFSAEQSRLTVGSAFTAPYDGMSIAEQQLVACEAAILTVLNGGVASGSFGNQSYSSLSLSELLAIKRELVSTIKNEADALAIAQGLSSGRQIHVRFTN
jgi:hypothetical protein